MDKILFLNLLYDFYGELLTEKQKVVFELYYLNDYSLHEIGEEFTISRQAVQDMLKRSERILQKYEEKLLLVDYYLSQKEKVSEVINMIDDLSSKHNLEQHEIKTIKDKIYEVLD